MTKYNDKKFFWLQLKEDFYDEDSIAWLEEQPNGEKYSNFYLKLCLKSLKTNGILIRRVGQILIPYDNEKLAELTRTKNQDTVTVAMALLRKIGLVTILANGEIFLPEIINMIGSKSIGALKKQQQRLIAGNSSFLQKKITGGQEVDKCPPWENIDLLNENDYQRRKRGHLSTKSRIRDRTRTRDRR
jgi:predicted phage replisome organizer